MLHHDGPRGGFRIARIHQPRSVAIEDRQHLVEHVAHHLLEVVRALNRPVDSVQALEEAEMVVTFLLGLLARGDIEHHPAQAGGAIFLHHHGHQVPHPDDASVGRDHSIFKIVIALLAGGVQAEIHRPVAVVGIQIIAPERGFGQPPFQRVAEDALCLLADERKPEARHIRLPDNPVDRVHQIAEPLVRAGRVAGIPGGELVAQSCVLCDQLPDRFLHGDGVTIGLDRHFARCVCAVAAL